MKKIDLSVLSTAEKDQILQQLINETMNAEEAKRYVQQSIKSVTTQKGNQISTTLQEKNKPYDLSPESVQQFLKNAPQEAKTFFNSNYMLDAEKLKAMNTFRYNEKTIDILDEKGNIVETMENKDHTVPDDQLQSGMIEKDELGNTHFSFAAIEKDELVPTNAEWENLLRLMPAGDYRLYFNCRAGKQLHALLGGKLSGFRSDGKTKCVDKSGFFQSRSVFGSTDTFALGVDGLDKKVRGVLFIYDRSDLRPVRRRARTAG